MEEVQWIVQCDRCKTKYRIDVPSAPVRYRCKKCHNAITVRPKPARCIQCKSELRPDAKFCHLCGTPVTFPEPVPEPSSRSQAQSIQKAPKTKAGGKHKILDHASVVSSWKTILLSIAITLAIYMIAGVISPKTKLRGMQWTWVWMVLTVEGWKYWKWKSLIPYPAYCLCAIAASFVVIKAGGDLLAATLVNAALNLTGIMLFAAIYYRRYKKERFSAGN